jgi:hypothetical protein
MTMNSRVHPDPERLAALAGADTDALADRELTDHVAGCAVCEREVHHLTTLRAALAELPDLAPSRPLQYLPPVAAPTPQAGWRMVFRRAFAPMAVAGMVLLLVGGIGATGSLGAADAQRLFPVTFQAAGPTSPAENPEVTTDGGGVPEAPAASDNQVGALGPTPTVDEGAAAGEDDPDSRAEETPGAAAGNDFEATGVAVSEWVLMAAAGLVLLVAAVVLRIAGRRPRERSAAVR